MFTYYLQLALTSLRRNRGLTALMILAIALGIALCIVMMTSYHIASSNPLWWKNDSVYSVTIDSWDPDRPANDDRPELPPSLLTFRDGVWIQQNLPAKHKVLMYKGMAVVSRPEGKFDPTRAITRLTTRDFFATFDVPFLYGGPWDARGDTEMLPDIVLSKSLNDQAFGGENSVGKTILWRDREFRVVGVIDTFRPTPFYYDLNNGEFSDQDDAFVPFAWHDVVEFDLAGNLNCWKSEAIESFAGLKASECVWLMMWAEFANDAERVSFQARLDNYVRDQKKLGRFQRPLNNRLANVGDWLAVNEVVGEERRVMVALAFAFLAICLLNVIGLLLAKFLNAASSTGVRRALGASRADVFWQHLVEASVISLVGALLGLVLAAAGLLGLREYYESAESPLAQLVRFEATSVLWAIALALLAGLGAGAYPAWRIGRLPPAMYLKS
jgi:putative ABC transport system permease protein